MVHWLLIYPCPAILQLLYLAGVIPPCGRFLLDPIQHNPLLLKLHCCLFVPAVPYTTGVPYIDSSSQHRALHGHSDDDSTAPVETNAAALPTLETPSVTT